MYDNSCPAVLRLSIITAQLALLIMSWNLFFVEFLLTRDNKPSIGLGRYKSEALVFSILIGFGYFRNCLCSSVRAIERFSAS